MNFARRATSVLAYVAIAGMLAACNGGHSSLPASPTSALGGSSGAPVPAGASSAAVYGGSFLQGATYVGPVYLKTVGLDVWVQSNTTALLKQAAAVNDPKSPLFRHWLTPQQIGAQFGASQADYTRLVKYLNSYGIAVQTFPQRQMLRIRGPQAGVQAALGLTLGLFKKNGQTFVAPRSAPSLPLGMKIDGMTSLVGYRFRSRNFVPVQAGNGLVQGYSPQQIANVFDYTGAYQAGYTGAGITIGIIGTGPITDGDPRLGTGGLGDVAQYRAMFGVGGSGTITQEVDLTNVSPGAGTGAGEGYSSGLATPPPVTNPNIEACVLQGVGLGYGQPTNYTTCNPEDVEAQLDTEQAASLAPNANVQFYIAYNPNECYTSGTYTTTCPGGGAPTQQLGIGLTDDEIQDAIALGTADIISMSFGVDEPDALGYYYNSSGVGFGPTEFADLALEGVAIFASSGDNGAQGCAFSSVQPNPNAECVSYPGTDPSVVSVGGVNAPLDSSGALSGPMTGWGQQTNDGGASGGGCSQTFTLASFENGLTPANPCVTLGPNKRSQPDISLDGDLNTGVAVVIDAPPTLGGQFVVPIGGTSVAAPEAAAMWALVLSACKAHAGCGSASAPAAYAYRLGNPNNYFYPVYQSANYGKVFYDVLYGANGLPYVPYGPTPGPTASPVPTFAPGYTAGPGLDLVTGIGVPYARNLIKQVVGI